MYKNPNYQTEREYLATILQKLQEIVEILVLSSPEFPEDQARKYLAICHPEITEYPPDISKCPQCKGPADNGFDRCLPPNPYNCTKCEQEYLAVDKEIAGRADDAAPERGHTSSNKRRPHKTEE